MGDFISRKDQMEQNRDELKEYPQFFEELWCRGALCSVIKSENKKTPFYKKLCCIILCAY